MDERATSTICDTQLKHIHLIDWRKSGPIVYVVIVVVGMVSKVVVIVENK